jgi:hypothetical protein
MSEGPNPFAPPKADWENVSVAVDPHGYVDAGQGARLANFFLDQVGRFGLAILLAAGFGENAAVPGFSPLEIACPPIGANSSDAVWST